MNPTELNQESLQSWMDEHWSAGNPAIQSIKKFKGGYSNLTFLLELSNHKVVLRRAPLGAAVKGGHDMVREYSILKALAPTLPACPKPLAVCHEPEVLGSPFFFMEFLEGKILRPGVASAELSSDQLRSGCELLIHTLAELHQVNPAEAGLDGIGKPEGYVARQVAGWIGRYRKVAHNHTDQIEALLSWLDNHQPSDGPVSVIHNDFKFDNVVMDLREPVSIKGILDWEMATVGHPWMDLGTTLAYWVEEHDGPFLKPFNITHLPGALSRAEVLSLYEEKTGTQVEAPVFYYAFGLFKVAVIALQIFARFRQGLTDDQRFAALGMVAESALNQASHAIDTGSVSG